MEGIACATARRPPWRRRWSHWGHRL